MDTKIEAGWHAVARHADVNILIGRDGEPVGHVVVYHHATWEGDIVGWRFGPASMTLATGQSACVAFAQREVETRARREGLL